MFCEWRFILTFYRVTFANLTLTVNTLLLFFESSSLSKKYNTRGYLVVILLCYDTYRGIE